MINIFIWKKSLYAWRNQEESKARPNDYGVKWAFIAEAYLVKSGGFVLHLLQNSFNNPENPNKALKTAKLWKHKCDKLNLNSCDFAFCNQFIQREALR